MKDTLRPYAEYRESGLPWLGEIPAHWRIVKLSRVARVFNGATPSQARSDFWEGGDVPWLTSGKVNDYLVTTPSQYITRNAADSCGLRRSSPGSSVKVLHARTRR